VAGTHAGDGNGERVVSRPTVVVTRRLPERIEAALAEQFDTHLNRTDSPLSAQALSDALRSADAVLCTVTDRFTAAHFGSGLRARVLANFGVGVNHIDLAAAKAAGLVVTNTPGVLTDDTADIALALILMTLRRLGEGERLLRTGAWSGWRPMFMLGHAPRGKMLGVVGYGRIGRALARRASLALGMRVQWWAPREPSVDGPEDAGPAEAMRAESLEALLATSDVVSLHCPSTAETRHLINAERLALMPPHAVLINTARGDIVDEHALVHALRDGVIASAGLDVYEFEPTVLPELRDLEHVVLLPHMGTSTVETREAMGACAVRNLAAVLAGEVPPNRVA
jgi:lactate dehydrogenase-like 2-hydroxyacid dehydrogenase